MKYIIIYNNNRKPSNYYRQYNACRSLLILGTKVSSKFFAVTWRSPRGLKVGWFEQNDCGVIKTVAGGWGPECWSNYSVRLILPCLYTKDIYVYTLYIKCWTSEKEKNREREKEKQDKARQWKSRTQNDGQKVLSSDAERIRKTHYVRIKTKPDRTEKYFY